MPLHVLLELIPSAYRFTYFLLNSVEFIVKCFELPIYVSRFKCRNWILNCYQIKYQFWLSRFEGEREHPLFRQAKIIFSRGNREALPLDRIVVIVSKVPCLEGENSRVISRVMVTLHFDQWTSHGGEFWFSLVFACEFRLKRAKVLLDLPMTGHTLNAIFNWTLCTYGLH